MTRRRSPFFAAVAAMAAAVALFAPASPARADGYGFQTPTEQYLAARRMYTPRAGLTLDIVSQEPSKYRGMTLELDGRLSGIVRSTDDDGAENAMLMLSTERYGSLSLTMSKLPSWLQSGERLRVLVVVTGGEPGTVEIGIPPMEVVAVASSLDIAAVEQRYQQQVAAREAARRKSRSAPLPKKLPRGTLASRGGAAGSIAYGSRGYIAGLSAGAQQVYPAYRSFIANHNRKLSDKQVDDITRTLLIFSERLDMDPRLVMAIFIAESDFDPNCTSHAGAMGIGQLMPENARELGLSNPYDPVQNVAGSIWLLKSHLNQYSGGAAQDEIKMRDIVLMAAAYNAGPGAVRKYKGVPPYRETQNYVKKVTRLYKQLCGGDVNG
jgi:hypothetical protein